MSKTFYPMLGYYGPPGPDHMAEQVRQATGEFPEIEDEQPSVVPSGGTEYDPKLHWRTKDGGLVIIVTMSESHLRNTLRMIWRAADAWLDRAVCTHVRVNEDDAAVEWAEKLASATPEELIDISPFSQRGTPLVEEWARRGFARNTWWARSSLRYPAEEVRDDPNAGPGDAPGRPRSDLRPRHQLHRGSTPR